MARRYQSVTEMAKHLTKDQKFQQELEKDIVGKDVAKTLFALRCREGITQAEMASRLGCTQSRISKLENSGLDGIKVSDLAAYAKALDLQASITFHKGMTAVQSVKFHALEIKKYLDHLAELAHRDDAIFEGVKSFYNVYLVNILSLFKKSADRLPKKRAKQLPVLEISAPREMTEEDVLELVEK